MKISVILPVYNLKEYLGFTLRNLTEEQFQNSDEWELILVNDGSTDGSEIIVREFAGQHPASVRLIDFPENRGVSNARNAALSEARGEYVFFADGDDILKPGSLPLLVDAAERSGCDILHFGYEEISPATYRQMRETCPPAEPCAQTLTIENASAFLSRTNGLIGPPVSISLWQNLFRTSFLKRNDATMTCGLNIGEDALFMWHALLNNPEIAVTSTVYYLYQLRDSGAIRNCSTNHIKALANGRFMYLDRLYEVRRMLQSKGFDFRTMTGLEIEMRNAFYFALADRIALGAGLPEIFTAMRNHKRNGGSIRIGRPRFYRGSDIKVGAPEKYRRWIAAYPLAILMQLFSGK